MSKKVKSFIENFQSPIGPVEVQEKNDICWNCVDWPAYIACSYSVEINELIKLIRYGWSLPKPQILLGLISDPNPLSNWTDAHLERLTQGLAKTACSAHLWLVTNGLHIGCSNLWSSAVKRVKLWQKAVLEKKENSVNATCIGVVREDRLTSDPLMQRYLKNIQGLNDQILRWQSSRSSNEISSESKKFYIDEQHSHFIFLRNAQEDEEEQILILELLYQLSFDSSWNDTNASTQSSSKSSAIRIPFVGVLMQGDHRACRVIHEYLIKQVPVLVFLGSGGMADLLHFVYEEVHALYAGQTKNLSLDFKNFSQIDLIEFDQEISNQELFPISNQIYSDEQLQLVITQKIIRVFPHLNENELNITKQLLLACVSHSEQDGVNYLNFVQVGELGNNLDRLDEYLLSSYIRCSRLYQPDSGILCSEKDLLHNHLSLMMDWNCARLAWEITSGYSYTQNVNIDKSLMIRALIEQNRQQFVTIFMQAGFKMRVLFNLATLEFLFGRVQKNAFFSIVCCERVLGITTFAFMKNNLLARINQLILLTSNIPDFFCENEFAFTDQPNCVEHKTISVLCMWALFTKNIELVRKLWRFHDQPIGLLLTCCNVLHNLAEFVSDIDLKAELIEYKNEFGDYATKLLDQANELASFRCDQLLSLKLNHFGKQMICDVAANGQVHMFLEHQATQRWLDRVYFNGIEMKRSRTVTPNPFMLMDALKIFLCVIFVFPILFWLHFPNEQSITFLFDSKDKNGFKNLSSISKECDLLKKYPQLANDMDCSSSVESKSFDHVKKKSLTTKWFILMQAPITKFWISQALYLIYLGLFTYTILQPACGNPQLDITLFFWYLALLLDDVYRTYRVLSQLISMHVISKYMEICIQCLFLVLLYAGRIAAHPSLSLYQYELRMCMCLALLHAFVRYVATYTPVHPRVGPLFYYLKRMATRDWLYFLLICFPIMLSYGIAVHVALFPDTYLTGNELADLYYRTVYTLFTTTDAHLKPTESCDSVKWIQPTPACISSAYQDKSCGNIGVWTYLFTFSFLVLVKLILSNILNALFFSSLAGSNKQTIWRYQRFNLIMFFAMSSAFPPPLNLFYYAFLIIKSLNIIPFLIGKWSQSISTKETSCLQCGNVSRNFFWHRTADICLKNNQQTFIGDNLKSVFIDKTNYDASERLKEIERELFRMEFSGDANATKCFVDKAKWLLRK